MLRIIAAALAAFLWVGAAFCARLVFHQTRPGLWLVGCGGHDCARWTIRKGSISAEPTGLRVRLTLEETRAINPMSNYPIDALVVWPRIQPSEDGDWHLCVMSHARSPETGGVYCLFQPPST